MHLPQLGAHMSGQLGKRGLHLAHRQQFARVLSTEARPDRVRRRQPGQAEENEGTLIASAHAAVAAAARKLGPEKVATSDVQT